MAEGDTLKFVSSSVPMCSVCRSFTGLSQLQPEQRKEFSEAQAGSQHHKKYMEALAKFEQQINESPNGYLRKELVEAPRVTVGVREVQAFRMSTMFGIWWPADVYAEIKGCAVPQEKLFLLEGKPGIIMTDADGCPIGCVKLERIRENSVVKDTALADSDTATLEGQADVVFDAAKRKVTGGVSIQAAQSDCNAGPILCVPPEKKLKKHVSEDSSGSADFLSLKAPTVASLLRSGSAESKSLSSGGGGGGQKRKRGKGCEVAQALPPTKKLKSPAKKMQGRLVEVQQIEDVLNQINHIKEAAKLSWKMLSETSLRTLLAKVNKKLDDKSFTLVEGALEDSGDEQEVKFASRARSAVASLRGEQAFLAALTELVAGLDGARRRKVQTDPTVLLAMYEEMVTNGAELARHPLQVILCRLALARIEEHDYDGVAKVFSSTDEASAMAKVA